ncbi:MAG: 3-hydroxybutyryl-CoA dehydrogenase [Chloroflexi bacterium]|nr:3-hydroxybutyryl-CoA dehydrogenase [Chloroflexota bacterium]
MNVSNINTVGIIGAGLMGHGIAIQFASKGFKVILNDLSKERLETSLKNIESTAEQAKLQTDKILDLINTENSLAETAINSDFLIEAVFEDLNVKRGIFERLDSICPKDTVLASNTSSFKASQLAIKCQYPERIIVANWWNPPHILPLIEVVKGPQVSAQTVQITMELFRNIGKSPVLLQKESLGFIGNRMQFALLREAISIVENGIATPKEVDEVVKNSFGRRLALAGPFQVFDAAGWDTILAIANQLFPDLESSPKEPKLITDMVENNELGIKSAKGFYDWDETTISTFRKNISEGLSNIDKFNE